MSGTSGELEPAANGYDVALVAAALRQDTDDLATYERVLVASLSDALPEGCVEIDRDRSLSDRVAGRPGTVRALRIRLGDLVLGLSSVGGRLVATVSRQVRGVAISSRDVPLAEWTTTFAQALSTFAQESAAAREALERMLGPSL